MEEQGACATQTEDVSLDLPGASWPDWRWLVLLVVLVAGMRAWQVSRTEVASRDCIAYVRYAWRLEVEPWRQVVRDSEHHPGYPVAVYLMAKPIRNLVPYDRPRTMQLSAQLVSCIASLLLVFPMFYLGRELFDRRVGFWAALLYQCLPASGRVLADGLSDPLFLLFAATSLWLAMIALRTSKPGWFVLIGVTSALAYLTRTEGVLVTLATGVVLLGLQASQRWRWPWKRVCRNGASLAGAAAMLVIPFMLLIGGVSRKPSLPYMIDPSRWKMAPATPPSSSAARFTVAPLPLALWKFGPNIRPEDRYGWAAWALLVELDKGFFHLLGLPTLVGLFLFRRRFAERPGAWVLLLSGSVLLLLLYRLGQSNGYIGERHVLLIVMGGLYFAVPALVLFGAWLASRLSRWRPGLRAGAVSLAILLLLALSPLWRTLARLHGDREGFRQAGLWLAQHLQPSDHVRDPFAWASYYAGRTFQPNDSEKPGDEVVPGVYYVVLEQSSNKHSHLYYLVNPAWDLVEKHQSELVERFPMRQSKKPGAEVLVYRVRIGLRAGGPSQRNRTAATAADPARRAIPLVAHR